MLDLTLPSGLTLSDYKTILGYNASDKNSIFADNYEAFYNANDSDDGMVSWYSTTTSTGVRPVITVPKNIVTIEE